MTLNPLLAAALLLAPASALHADHHGEDVFSKHVVDIGIVVSDLEASLKFYTEVLGCKKASSFEVDAKRATAFGLTDNQPAKITVLALGDSDARTSLKLMSFPEAPGKKADHEFIHSTLGFSYLTLFVTDMDAALERLKKADVKLLGETPAPLGGKTKIAVVRDPDGNFVELIGPTAE